MMQRFFPLAFVALTAAPTLVASQALPPAHDLGPSKISAEHFLGISQVRQLGDGRVLVNDQGSGRLVLLDSALTNPIVVLDTAVKGAAHAYPQMQGHAFGTAIAYIGDTTVFADPVTRTLLIVDPAGRIVRAIASPNTGGNSEISDVVMGFDGKSGILYRQRYLRPGPGVTQPGLIDMTAQPDSDLIVRADLARRTIDTVAYVRTQTFYPRRARNPMPMADDAVLTSGGTLAVIRAQDYHIDWVAPDDHATASPKLPYPWRRLLDADKAAIIDSERAHTAASTPQPAVVGRGGAPARTLSPPVYPDPSELPDYGMPFISGRSVADADGNVWIARQAPLSDTPSMDDILIRGRIKSDQSAQTYDVVNRAGVIIDRVIVPGETTIVGFGPGVVYLTSREGYGSPLMRARIR